jgi:hypothetical protein
MKAGMEYTYIRSSIGFNLDIQLDLIVAVVLQHSLKPENMSHVAVSLGD